MSRLFRRLVQSDFTTYFLTYAFSFQGRIIKSLIVLNTKATIIPSYIVDCVWSDWIIGICSKTCGGGSRTNIRKEKVSSAHGGNVCKGPSSELEACNIHECPPRNQKSLLNYSKLMPNIRLPSSLGINKPLDET